MRKLLIACVLAATANLYLLAGAPGLAYLDVANVFTANQRINAGVGINVAPGATGTLSLSSSLFERSRSTAMGEWTAVPYSSGNFAAVGGGTWTVDSGDQNTFKYTLVGKTMIVQVLLNTTSVSGTVNTFTISIPGGFTANDAVRWFSLDADNTSGAGTYTLQKGGVDAGGTKINIDKLDGTNWAASTNNTDIRISITFEVS